MSIDELYLVEEREDEFEIDEMVCLWGATGIIQTMEGECFYV